jgi:hypothetical protein
MYLLAALVYFVSIAGIASFLILYRRREVNDYKAQYEELLAVVQQSFIDRAVFVRDSRGSGDRSADDIRVRILPLDKVESYIRVIPNDHQSPAAEQ